MASASWCSPNSDVLHIYMHFLHSVNSEIDEEEFKSNPEITREIDLKEEGVRVKRFEWRRRSAEVD